MLEQITQIKLALANVQANMQGLIHEREQFITEITKLRNENTQLQKNYNELKDEYERNIKKTTSEIS